METKVPLNLTEFLLALDILGARPVLYVHPSKQFSSYWIQHCSENGVALGGDPNLEPDEWYMEFAGKRYPA